MRGNKCKNCIKLEVEKRLFTPQPYQLKQGQLVIEHQPFDVEGWNKVVASLPCISELPYLLVSQVKVGDVLVDHSRLEWKQWEGSDKPLTVIVKGGRDRLFTLRDMNGKEYRASGKRLTCYSHTIIVRDGQFIGRFFCKYW